MPETLEGSGPLSIFRMRKGLTLKGEELAIFVNPGPFWNNWTKMMEELEQFNQKPDLSLLEKGFGSLQGRNRNCSTQNPGGIWNPFPF